MHLNMRTKNVPYFEKKRASQHNMRMHFISFQSLYHQYLIVLILIFFQNPLHHAPGSSCQAVNLPTRDALFVHCAYILIS